MSANIEHMEQVFITLFRMAERAAQAQFRAKWEREHPDEPCPIERIVNSEYYKKMIAKIDPSNFDFAETLKQGKLVRLNTPDNVIDVEDDTDD